MNTPRRTVALALIAMAGAWAAVSGPALAADKGDVVRGYVDGQGFVDLADPDAELVEITLQGSLLRSLAQVDDELSQVVGGIERIHAVILQISPASEPKARDLLKRTEAGLTGNGWEIIARVRESGSEMKVLVLNDQEKIRGLVVMGLDNDDRKLIFTNVAGVLDLAAIERVGAQFEVPGLEDLGAKSGKSGKRSGK